MARRRDVAEHEAGHAAIAIALGVKVLGISLTPIGDYSGYVDVGNCNRLQDALISAAGPAADALSGRYSHRALRRAPREWRYDYADIRKRGFKPRERALLVRIASRMLEGECNALWQRLTRALLERDLTADDVLALAVE